MADKIDFKKVVNAYRATQNSFEIIDVPSATYLMLDGSGDPNTSPLFTSTLKTLYPIAYKLKFTSKRELDRDYVVPPLEGLWWADDMESFTVARNKSQWSWTMMLMIPDWLELEMVRATIEKVGAKNPPDRIGDVKVTTLSEGQCIQTLHIGSFDDEAVLLDRMHHEFIANNDYVMTGKHHEIYLSDFRRTPPERQRTILRQPVKSRAGHH